jgi:hypothetical protein
MDTDWTESLTPHEAQAALDGLDAHNQVALTVNEAYELMKLKRALLAKTAPTSYRP